MILEQLIFTILAFGIFVYMFFKMIRENDTNYIGVLIIEAIGISLNFIEVLKKIKLLRKIGISVEDIKSVLNDNVTLENCLEKYLDVLEKQKSNLTNMYNLTEEIINQKCELNNLKTDEWLEKMENMEKEGIDFVNISKIDIHMKKKMGAIIGGAVMIVFMLFLIGMFLWGNSVDPIPLGLLIVLVAIPVVIIVCIIGVLIGRIREIDGGEEDEAAKY